MGRIHPNVLKARKQKRNNGRRAYLTNKFSIIHVPRAIGQEALQTSFPEHAQALFKYGDRVAGEMDLLKEIMPAVEWTISGSEADKMLDLIQSEEVVDFVKIKDAPIQQYKLCLIFNRRKTVLFFVKADFFNKIVEKSKQYGSLERAMFDFHHNRISYHDVLPLHSLHLVLPNRRS